MITTFRRPRPTLHHAAREREIKAFAEEWGYLTEDLPRLRANWHIYPIPACVFAKRRARWANEVW